MPAGPCLQTLVHTCAHAGARSASLLHTPLQPGAPSPTPSTAFDAQTLPKPRKETPLPIPLQQILFLSTIAAMGPLLLSQLSVWILLSLGRKRGVSMSWPPVPLCSGPRAGCLHTTQLCPGAVSPFLCHAHSGALTGGCASLHTSCKSSQEPPEQPSRAPGWDKPTQTQPGGEGGGTFWEGDLTKPRLLRLQAGKVPAASLPSRATEGCRDYFFSLEIKIHFHIFKTL